MSHLLLETRRARLPVVGESGSDDVDLSHQGTGSMCMEWDYDAEKSGEEMACLAL
jgi:hypothetical protein